MKRYIDPTDRPTRQPLTDVDKPFLAESDVPSDSFSPQTEEPEPPADRETIEIPAPVQAGEAQDQICSPRADMSTPPSQDSSPASDLPTSDESDNED